jgi:hypothetical protein
VKSRRPRLDGTSLGGGLRVCVHGRGDVRLGVTRDLGRHDQRRTFVLHVGDRGVAEVVSRDLLQSSLTREPLPAVAVLLRPVRTAQLVDHDVISAAVDAAGGVRRAGFQPLASLLDLEPPLGVDQAVIQRDRPYPVGLGRALDNLPGHTGPGDPYRDLLAVEVDIGPAQSEHLPSRAAISAIRAARPLVVEIGSSPRTHPRTFSASAVVLGVTRYG